MDRFVTIAIFTLPHEMAVIRARLEWEGITCFAQDEHTVSANPLYSNLVGGIKLQVPAEDAVRARAILVDAAGGASEEGPVPAGPLIVPSATGAHDTDRTGRIVVWSILVGIILLLLLT